MTHDDDTFFTTPAKGPIRGVLPHSLSTAAEERGRGLTPKDAKVVEKQMQRGRSRGADGKGGATANWEEEGVKIDCTEEVANEEDRVGGRVAELDRPITPTPSRWTMPTVVPVMPTKGSKRMPVV
jgi:hypothetical protein